jgi:hypothetical protein
MRTEIEHVIEFETPSFIFEIEEPETDEMNFLSDRDPGDEDAHDIFEG